jgi:glycosyltransferase involved in cell wall biosynthesis
MVSVLIITWKRTALLQKCLESLAHWADRLPLQVVVVVNGPDRESEDWLSQWSASRTWLEWSPSEARSPGAARNEGVKRLAGDWCFLIDDDATVPENYLQEFLQLKSQHPQVDVWGGPDAPEPQPPTPLARAVGIALSSPLCTGPTVSRHHPVGSTPVTADERWLTSCNLWVKTHWLRQIPFPVENTRGEETVFLQRLVRAGAVTWYAPSLRVWHARRSHWGAVGRASFWGGYWRSRNCRAEKGDGIFWLPAVFVLMHSLLPTAWGTPLAVIWLCGVLPVALRKTQGQGPGVWARVVLLHWFIPFTYGAGFLYERLPWRK